MGSGVLRVPPLPLEMMPSLTDETNGCHSAIMRSVRFEWALESSRWILCTRVCPAVWNTA